MLRIYLQPLAASLTPIATLKSNGMASELADMVRTRAKTLGVEVIGVRIRDIILLGEMKDLMNRVTEAKKAAEAIRRAGLQPWPRLFHNLTASRETALAEHYPVQVVTSWLGNTPNIAMKHDLMTTDEHFAQAIGSGDSDNESRKAVPEPSGA